MADTAIAYGESGVGKTSICISLAKLFYKEFKLTTRLISCEGWSPLENDALISSGIVSAYNINTRPKKILADMRKLSRGYWPKVIEEDVPILDSNGIETGRTERKMVRRIVEDQEALNKVGLYFIETIDGISDKFMSHLVQEETIEMSERGKLVVKSIGPQASSGRYEEDGEVFGGNSQGHYRIVQVEMHDLFKSFEGLKGKVKLVFWTAHVGEGKFKGENVMCPLVVGEACNAKAPGWVGECFHLEEIPRVMNEYGQQIQDKQVKAYYESHRETGLMEGPRFLCKSRVGFSDLQELQQKFPGGFIPLGIQEGEGLDQYYRWLYGRKGANKQKMIEWKGGLMPLVHHKSRVTVDGSGKTTDDWDKVDCPICLETKPLLNLNQKLSKERIIEVRESLVVLRNECLGSSFDPDGAVILSHAIRWLSFKEEGKPYERTTD